MEGEQQRQQRRRWRRRRRQLWRLQWQGQIVAVAAMTIAQFTLEGVHPDPRGTKLATYSNILDFYGVCRFYL